MSPLVYRITDLLCGVVKNTPVGTNWGLMVLLWTLMSGRLLESRGAITPAIADFGLEEGAVRRTWGALRYGHWEIDGLLKAFEAEVQRPGAFAAAVGSEGRW